MRQANFRKKMLAKAALSGLPKDDNKRVIIHPSISADCASTIAIIGKATGMKPVRVISEFLEDSTHALMKLAHETLMAAPRGAKDRPTPSVGKAKAPKINELKAFVELKKGKKS